MTETDPGRDVEQEALERLPGDDVESNAAATATEKATTEDQEDAAEENTNHESIDAKDAEQPGGFTANGSETKMEDVPLTPSVAAGHENENEAENANETGKAVAEEPLAATPPPLPNDSSATPSQGTSTRASPQPEDKERRRRKGRTPSIALSVSSTSSGQHTVSSMVFIKGALERIVKSKDAKRMTALDASAKKALKQMEQGELPQPAALFQPLQLVCTSGSNSELKCVALDCMAKLFQYSYFEDPEPTPVDPESGVTPPPQVPLVHRAVSAVCECRKKDGDAKVEMQAINALGNAALNDDLPIHEKALLDAVRNLYEVFVRSTETQNQALAQAQLLQIINNVFDRIKTSSAPQQQQQQQQQQQNEPESQSEPGASNDNIQQTRDDNEAQVTLERIENLSEEHDDDHGGADDASVRDAYLVFRTLCKISARSQDGADLDPKSQFMRSKLITLHLVHSVLKNHMSVFMSQSITLWREGRQQTFVEAIRDYVCLTLVRNMSSISAPVFELTAEIFWLILSNLRASFKRHLELVFEQYFQIMEVTTTPVHSKQYFLVILQRTCNDPRALVELFLNYDCDRDSNVNPYEKIINTLIRFAGWNGPITPLQLQHFKDKKKERASLTAMYNLNQTPVQAINGLTTSTPRENQYPLSYALKVSAVESIVAVLRSLLIWSQRTSTAIANGKVPSTPRPEDVSELKNNNASETSLSSASGTGVTNGTTATTTSTSNGSNTPRLEPVDDPAEFARLKQRKADLHDAISDFNYRPKRGLERLMNMGYIERDDADSAAKFFLEHTVDKAALGEFLGEPGEYHIAVMHSFVNMLSFEKLGFVEALRYFLQYFRLPGEAQKIDRLILAFASRYCNQNTGTFADANAAYVLAYSVVLLNTDQHSPTVRTRMTVEDFIKNCRGINDGNDFPREFLVQIYDEIHNNEIKLDTEQQQAMATRSTKNSGGGFFLTRNDGQREAYLQASKDLSNEAERKFYELSRNGEIVHDKGRFYIASHVNHVKPMFEVMWGSVLVGISVILRDSEDSDVIKMCIDAFRYSIRLACWFPDGQSNSSEDDTSRTALINGLEKFMNLNSPEELTMKNVYAIRLMLDLALTEGNTLDDSWRNVLTCISQLERLQYINSGIASESIPDVASARIKSSSSSDSRKSTSSNRGHQYHHSHGGVPMAAQTPFYSEEVRAALNDDELKKKMERILEQTSQLTGEAVINFVNALAQVSMEEIQSSGNTTQPRTDALSKMVSVCHYNMGRIRVEWAKIWETLGAQFNQICCNSNHQVVYFALDALKQLSARFLTIEELPHFKFQQDFLQPFEYTMVHNPDLSAKEMVLDCLHTLIQLQSKNIRSGWSKIFQVFAAASVSNPKILSRTFRYLKNIYDNHLEQLIQQGGFTTMVECLGEIAKNPQDQRTALHAIELLKDTIPMILRIEGGEEKQKQRGDMWYAILKALQRVIIQSRDLEVRSRALNCLFDSLTVHGSSFDGQTWDSICGDLLFPIFDTLGQQSLEEETVWLSTTMVQALRNMIMLFTYNFDILERMLDGFLDLLVRCIDQENDTVSKIGSSCLAQLITDNVQRLQPVHWTRIVDRFDLLFRNTTAEEVFTIAGLATQSQSPRQEDPQDVDARRHDRAGSIASVGLDDSHMVAPHTMEDRQRLFRPTIIKSILQRLMISTVNDLIAKKPPVGWSVSGGGEPRRGSAAGSEEEDEATDVFEYMPTEEILRVARMLQRSYEFSRRFNNDRELRERIWKQRYMQDMPNLLTQESISALTYVNLMMRLYQHEGKMGASAELRLRVEQQLMPQCVEILRDYNNVDSGQKRYISTIWPVVHAILTEYLEFTDDQLRRTIRQFWPHVVHLLSKEMVREVREQVMKLMERVGTVVLEINGDYQNVQH